MLPEVPYNVFSCKSLRVSKTVFVCIDTNKYGLSRTPMIVNTLVINKRLSQTALSLICRRRIMRLLAVFQGLATTQMMNK